MTNKELLYIEDTLEHEKILASCACKASNQLQDVELKEFLKKLETEHQGLLNRMITLL